MAETNPLQPVPVVPITSEISPELKINQQALANMSNDVKTKATANYVASQSYNNFLSSQVVPNSFDVFRDNRIALKDYSINVGDVYETLNDGTGVAMFDTFIPGVNNYEREAQAQSTTDKWLNGITKFAGKTGTAVIGGTVGFAYGIGQFVSDGSLTSLYDNDFNRTMDDWNSYMDYTLPNRYTQQESQKGLFGQAGTANFWADKVLGGLSFTAGALVSEGIWAYATGGASLGTVGARLGAKIPWSTKALGLSKVAQGVNKSKSVLKQPLLAAYGSGEVAKNTAIALGKAGDLANLARFTITSAGYEASIEALQYKNEQRENFYSEFQNLNGRQPSQEETQIFEKNLEDSSNAVFGVNMALVGASNLVMMGNVFELRNPINLGITDFIEKKAFGRGITSTIVDGKNVSIPIAATRAQKVSRSIFDYGKSPITEGIVEEGGQGVTSNAAGKWLQYSYDPQKTQENIELSGLVYESLGEQYGTKEGWVENGVGMIIGALGGTVNARRGQQQRQEQLEYKVSGINNFTEKVISERFLMANRMNSFSEEAETERQKGNIVKSKLATDGVLHAKLNHAYQLGQNVDEVVEEATIALNTVTPQQFKDAGITETDIDDYKENVINEYRTLANQFKKNRKFAEYVIGRSRIAGIQEVTSQGNAELNTNNQEAVIQSLTWNLTAGDNSLQMMNDIRSQISSEIGDEQSRAMNTVQKLQVQQASIQNEVSQLRNTYTELTAERDRLQRSIIELQNSPRETEGDRVAGAELGERNVRLLEVESEIEATQNRLQSIADEINSQTNYQSELANISDVITPENLINLNSDLARLRNTINGLQNVNPQRYAYLNDLIDEYNQAQELYNANQTSARLLQTGQIKLKQLNSWLSGRLNRNASIDTVTKNWLVDMLRTYEKTKVQGAASTLENAIVEEVITDEVYQLFVDNNEVSDEVLTSIAQKVMLKQPLSIREQAIFENRTVDINDIIRETPVPNVTEEIEAQTVLSDAERLRQRLNNLLSRQYNSLTYIGENYDDLFLKKPTKAEIEEYRELRDNNTENERFLFLQEKLGNWKLLDSAVADDNQSIVDLIDLIEQLETTIETEDTLDELAPDDIATITQSDRNGVTDTTVRYDLAQNVKGSITAQILRDKTTGDVRLYKFSHMKMSSILDALNVPLERTAITTSDGKKVKTPKRSNFENYSPGTIFTIDQLKFTIGSGNTIEMTENTYNDVREALDAHIVVPNINWSYFDVYERNGRKKPSDFQENTNPELIYNVRPGESLSVRIAQNDSFNESLRDKSAEEIEKQLKLEIVYKGQAISTLKATNNNVVPNDNFLLLRQLAAQAFIKGENLSASLKAQKVFLGSPQITTENLQSVNIDIDAQAAQKVIATGYIENGNFNLSREVGEVDRTYLSGFNQAQQNLKIPIIVFKKGVYNIAYPVTLKKSPAPMSELIVSIVENNTLSPTEKIKQINDQIIQTGIAADKRLTRYDENQIQAIIEDFAANQRFVSMSEFSSANYKLNNIQFDAEINIDLNNLDQVISDPKLEIDLDSIQVQLGRADRFDNMVSIENRLNELAENLSNDYISFADSKYVDSRGLIIEDTTYTNAFDDNEVLRNVESNIQKQANIRILRQAFSEKIPKSIQNVIGRETIQEVENLLKKYDMIRQQTTPNRETAQEIISDNSCG